LNEYERLKDAFVVDNKMLKGAKSTMVVMHPLPRNAEVKEEVDFDQRAAYFRQVSFFPMMGDVILVRGGANCCDR